MFLEPMARNEFEVFLEMACVGFAQNSPKYQTMNIEDARKEIKAHFLSQIAPQGFETPGHFFLNIYKEKTKIGYFHFAEASSPSQNEVFAWDFQIFENHRGQGLAKQCMELAANFLRAKGYKKVGLNVFATNKIAIDLYESMGFETTQINMTRDISGS